MLIKLINSLTTYCLMNTINQSLPSKCVGASDFPAYNREEHFLLREGKKENWDNRKEQQK